MSEYAAGRTPNPCLRCNEKIKFAAVLDRALGARLRRRRHRPLRPAAHRARRADRDAPGGRPRQGPVLRARRAHPGAARPLAVPARRLDQAGRARGGRAARAAGRRQAGQPRHLLRRRRRQRAAGCARSSATGRPTSGGDIVDQATGEVLGHHDGTFGFTIGQRKGLRLGRPAPDGKPRFVLDIEPVSGTVTVGPRSGLTVDRLTGDQAALVRHGPDPARGHRPAPRARRRAPRGRHRCADGDEVDDRAARPRRGHRPRPGRGGLRRHPRRRVGHDLRDGAGRRALVTPGYSLVPTAAASQSVQAANPALHGTAACP